MKCLADTNVILRWTQRSAPEHPVALQAITHLLNSDVEVVLSSQNIIEFWNVATRPATLNGLGWSGQHTSQAIADLEALFSVLHETESVYREWLRIVRQYGVQGRQVYDARLVAFVSAYSIDWLLSFNEGDFRRYTEIKVIHPQFVLQALHQEGS